MRRNGVIGELNKLHWVWKLMLISGSFGVVQAVIRRGKGSTAIGRATTAFETQDRWGNTFVVELTNLGNGEVQWDARSKFGGPKLGGIAGSFDEAADEAQKALDNR